MHRIRAGFTPTARLVLATLTVAAIVVPTAFGGGEPKNEPPFTRIVTVAGTYRTAVDSVPGVSTGSGEPKNEYPFTRPVSGGLEHAVELRSESAVATRVLAVEGRSLNVRFGDALTRLSSPLFVALFADGGWRLTPSALNALVVRSEGLNRRYR